MAENYISAAAVGQPFLLGDNEIAIFQAANQWTVFYLQYPEGDWLYTSIADWRNNARPIRFSHEFEPSGAGVLGRDRFLRLGTRVQHPEFGSGYVVEHSDAAFEVCFESCGPKTLAFGREWVRMKVIEGVGALWLPEPASTTKMPEIQGGQRLNVAYRSAGASGADSSVFAKLSEATDRPPLSSASAARSRLLYPMGGPDADLMKGAVGLPPVPKQIRTGCTCNGIGPRCNYCQKEFRPKKSKARKGGRSPAGASPAKPTGTPKAGRPKSLYRSPTSDAFGREKDRLPILPFAPNPSKIQCPHCGVMVGKAGIASHKRKCARRRR